MVYNILNLIDELQQLIDYKIVDCLKVMEKSLKAWN